MTTNQTIDRVLVSCELLKVALGYPNNGDEMLAKIKAREELRALLDAPIPFPGYPPVPEDRKLPAAQPQGDIETLRAALRTEVDAGDSWKREALELREKLESQPRGEPVAYRYKELQQAWENEKPWELATVSLGRVYLERKELAERGVLVGKERETYLGLTIEPLYAEQPAPVAVVMSFDFEHPSSKERRTVALSKQDVFDGMEDYFYDKIGEQICRCESVGETNVVDCSCDEYVHDFEIVKASLTS